MQELCCKCPTSPFLVVQTEIMPVFYVPYTSWCSSDDVTTLSLYVAQGLNPVTKRVAEDLVKASVSSVRTSFTRNEMFS